MGDVGSIIDGLGEAEPRQFADSMAAGLALAAVIAGLAYLFGARQRALVRSPLLTGATAILVAGLALPAMLSAGSHAHAGGGDESAAGHHAGGTTAAVNEPPASAVPPKAFDPLLPIDLGGVPDVTPEQQARAENLLAITLIELPQFSDPATIEKMGFVSIGDGGTGSEHYLNAANTLPPQYGTPTHPG